MFSIFKKNITLIVFAFMAFTFYFTLFGERGLVKIYKLRHKLSEIKAQKAFLGKDNLTLNEHIRKMKKERIFQEREARETLGLVKEDEIVYEFSK